MVEYFAIGQACETDNDCPEACYTSRVSKYKIRNFDFFKAFECIDNNTDCFIPWADTSREITIPCPLIYLISSPIHVQKC